METKEEEEEKHTWNAKQVMEDTSRHNNGKQKEGRNNSTQHCECMQGNTKKCRKKRDI